MGNYLLGQSTSASERLDIQHEMLKSMANNKLLPIDIMDINPSQTYKVADVATGTGIWLLQLSQLISPNSILAGFDISADKFPVETPPNISFHTQNILEPFPQAHLGQYDIVHVRLLALALGADDWPSAFKNVIALLKPGGYLAWEDTSMGLVTTSPCTRATCKLMYMVHLTIRATGKDPLCGSNLLTRFEAAGLKDCKQTHLLTADKPALFSVVNKTQCDAYRELLRGAILKGGIEDVKTAEDVEAFMEELLHDVEQGTNFHWILSCVVGRKGNVE